MGKLISVGVGEEYKPLLTETTKIYDMNNKAILPGFIESHNHFNAVANQWGWIDVGITKCTTIPEVLNTIKNAALDLNKQQTEASNLPWIKCVGFDDTLIAESRDLVKEEIDEISGIFPVWIWH